MFQSRIAVSSYLVYFFKTECPISVLHLFLWSCLTLIRIMSWLLLVYMLILVVLKSLAYLCIHIPDAECWGERSTWTHFLDIALDCTELTSTCMFFYIGAIFLKAQPSTHPVCRLPGWPVAKQSKLYIIWLQAAELIFMDQDSAWKLLFQRSREAM